MEDIDLNLVTALDVLLTEGSVTGAARRLGLSQSAMSRTLARLRAATGDPLLVPSGRGMVPTPRAEALRGQARQLAQEVVTVLSPQPAALDLASLSRTFTLRANDAFVQAFAPRLIGRAEAEAPGVRLSFAPRADKSMRPLREGQIDLDVGVVEEAGPEFRIQTLYRDRFVGIARAGHPLLQSAITPEAFAACRHIVTSKRGLAEGPVDRALAALGLRRMIAVLVPTFPAAAAIARESDLISHVPQAYLPALPQGVVAFLLPVETPELTISLLWHPRFDADQAHRWLRGLVTAACRDVPRNLDTPKSLK
jgi:DNA-binding transcriptional LysR family regulator